MDRKWPTLQKLAEARKPPNEPRLATVDAPGRSAI
jgi:hypothetical protein